MTTAPIRVAFFEPYPMGLGGNFVTQKLFLELLDPITFHPIVIAPRDGAALDHFRSMGVECVVLPASGALQHYGGLLRRGLMVMARAALDLFKYNRELVHLIRDKKIDIIYANCVRAQSCIGLACWWTGIPSLLYVKSSLSHPLVDRPCLISASRVLFFCAANRDDQYPLLTRLLRRKIAILPIGMDPREIETVERKDLSALRLELSIDPECFNVAVLAQLFRPKGQDIAIEALARLCGEFPHIRLYLVGDHVIDEYRSYRAELESLAARHNLSSRIIFTGWRRDSLEIASLMDAILHPSLAEGFGLAVLEGMALGKPVIASAVGGLREAIQDGRNGFLVPPSDVGALTSKWRQVLMDEKLRNEIGIEARRTVFTKYLIDDKVIRFAKILTGMVAERKAS